MLKLSTRGITSGVSLKSRKVFCSCGCTAEDYEYEVLYIVVNITLAHGFVNAYLLRFLCKVVKMDKNEAEDGGDVSCSYFADYLCGNHKEIGQ